MQVDNTLKNYNNFILNSIKQNKFTFLFFSTVTAFGFFSLPYLEKYHKTIKEQNADEDHENNENKK